MILTKFFISAESGIPVFGAAPTNGLGFDANVGSLDQPNFRTLRFSF